MSTTTARPNNQVTVRPSTDVAEMPRDLRWLRSEAAAVANSHLVPEALRGDVDSVLLVALRGKSLGLSLTTSLDQIYVIEGRTLCSAQVAGAVARRYCDWWVEESSSERCTIAGHRLGRPERISRTTFSIDDARHAGLMDIEWRQTKWDREKNKATVVARWIEGDGPKPAWVDPSSRDVRKSWRENWHRWPANMLFARAVTNWVRMNCGEALLGIEVDVDMGAVPDVVDHVQGGPARVDVVEREADDGIVEAELVEQPPARAWAHWADSWTDRCKQLGASRDISKALIHYATQGLTILSVDVPEGQRNDCDALLAQWAQDRPDDVQAWLNQPGETQP